VDIRDPDELLVSMRRAQATIRKQVSRVFGGMNAHRQSDLLQPPAKLKR
jgi:hypothetical protein